MEPKKRKHNPNPRVKANWLSAALFCWTGPVFKTASKRPLSEKDLYDVLPQDSSIKLSNTLAREWEKQLYKSKTGHSYSLQTALFKSYIPAFIGLSILHFIVECLRTSQVIFLGLILRYFENQPDVDWFLACMYSVGWCLCYILVIILDNLSAHQSQHTGLRMKVAVTAVIYRKMLRLSQFSLQDHSTSDIVSILSADTNSFDQSCVAVSYLWIVPCQTVAVMVLLWLHVGIGPYCFIGFVILLIIAPIQYYLGKHMSNLRVKVSQLTDRRVRQMHDILLGLKCIKMNCWENPFTTLIRTVRSSEWAFLKRISHYRGLNSTIYWMTAKLLVFTTFTVFILLGNTVSVSVLFTTLGFYEVLRTSVSLMWPWTVVYLHQSSEALSSIQRFLLLEERNTVQTPAQLSLLNRSPLPENVTLRFEDFTASWNKQGREGFTLDALNLSVQKSQIVVITGNTGSGKTSMLNAVLGELPRLGGFVRTRGKLGFVSQNTWIFSATFRENVMFGLEMDRRKYNKVLYASSLVKDLDHLPFNDLTVVGEKGTSLTAAQRAKIGLARAVYQGADIYLVDDIFSVIDEREATHIFTKCFCGLVSTTTVVLVTHQPQFIRAADTILLMKQGKVTQKGSFEELVKRGLTMKDLVPDYEPDRSAANQNIDSNTIDKESSTMKQKLWLDHFYSSQETLDKIWLQFEDMSDSDLLTSDDDVDSGSSAPVHTCMALLRIGGGVCGVTFFIIFSVITLATYILCDWWLYQWSLQSYNVTASPPLLLSDPLSTLTFSPPTTSFYVYFGLFVGFCAALFCRSSMFSLVMTWASKLLHDKMLSHVMRAPVSFLDNHSTETILNRFGQDQGFLDFTLPSYLFDVVQFALLVVGAVAMVAVANYWLLIGLVPVTALFILGVYKYMRTASGLKLLQMHTKLSVYQHLSNTLEGLWTVRAFGAEERFLRYFDTYMDRHTAACYITMAVNRWFSLRMDLLSAIVVCLLPFVSIAVNGFTGIHVGLLGLALVYSVNLLGLGQCCVRQVVELNNQLGGVERILKYHDIKTESAIVTLTRPSPLWPQYGIVTFEGVGLKWGEDNLRGLRNVWCCFRAEEKVGVVGSPEVCKRALVASLLRLAESRGTIRIDGIDITDIGLQDLRDKITVIPMEPVLFGGSMRRNLDPFSRHPDAHLWKALEIVHLRDKLESLPGKMYADLGHYGNNFSLGERQLICIARALLRPSKILIYEETPSIISSRCEKLIHHLLQTKFKASTIILIAQRPHRVVDTDRVMVLVDGRVKEFDPPHVLLDNSKSHYYKLLNSNVASQSRFNHYRQVAKHRYDNKPYTAPPQSLGGDGVLPYANTNRTFLPSFHNNRLSGVLSQVGQARFAANNF